MRLPSSCVDVNLEGPQPRVFRLLEMCTDSGEGMGRFRSVAAEGGCDVWFAGQSEEADGEVAQPGHNLRCGAGSYLRAVFIQGHIPYPVDPVFDTPMTSPQIEQPDGVSFLRRQAGNCVGRLPAGSSFPVGDALQPACLGQMGPVAVACQQVRSP